MSSAGSGGRLKRCRDPCGWDLGVRPSFEKRRKTVRLIAPKSSDVERKSVPEQTELIRRLRAAIHLAGQQVMALLAQSYGPDVLLDPSKLILSSVDRDGHGEDASARHARRIYVGSLPYDVVETHITQYFAEFGTIRDIEMPRERGRSKGFCFVEYETPIAADRAIAKMNGFMIGGRAIRVNRPTLQGGEGGDVLEGSEQKKTEGSDELCGLSTNAIIPSACYVGSLDYNLSPSDVVDVFSSFGRILDCKLTPHLDIPGAHRGFGFVLFADQGSAAAAIQQFNGFNLMNRPLKVGAAHAGAIPREWFEKYRAVLLGEKDAGSTECKGETGGGAGQSEGSVAVPSEPSTSGTLTTSDTASTSESTTTQDETAPQNSTQDLGQVSNPVTVAAPAEDTCICLLNLASDMQQVDADFRNEVMVECARFGAVEGMHVRAQLQTGLPEVYVRYAGAGMAAEACAVMNGRAFDGRTVVCRVCPPPPDMQSQ